MDVHGDVRLIVTVDVSGDVSSAEVVEGPAVFHEEALRAAQSLQFSPAKRDGAPVAARTYVSFHFAPPIDEGWEDHISEIVVHGYDADAEDTHSRETLTAEDLESSAGDDLAEAVEAVAGVSLQSGAADVSKPIIRGHQERRLLVLFDGVRHASQKWGPDHGTEIDPFAAGEISVIRGAAGTRYGPDAIGGVILVLPPPMRTEPGVGGKLLTRYGSNGHSPFGAARIDVASDEALGLSARLEGNFTASQDKQSPDYLLGNTASQVGNIGGAVQLKRGTTTARVTAHHYDLRAGVFYGVQNSTPDEFEAQLEASTPVGSDNWTADYNWERPYQSVQHDQVAVHLDSEGTLGDIETHYAYQVNHRREFEPVRGDSQDAQYDFTLRTHNVDTLYRHLRALRGKASFEGGVGVQLMMQENVYEGLPLLPNYRAFSGGLLGFERLSLPRFDLEVGVRYDRMARTAFLGRQDYERHARRGTLTPSNCDATGDAFRCPQNFDGASVSIGGLAHLVEDTLDFKLDLSSATRFPNVDESYLIGSAPTLPVYALGNPDLGTESTWGTQGTLALRTRALEGEVSGYLQRIQNYIAFQPELGPGGTVAYDVTIRGAWPRYAYQPIEAVLTGVDGTVHIAPEEVVGAQLAGAIVSATDVDAGNQLVGTPPDNAMGELIVRPPSFWRVRDPELAVGATAVARQFRVDPDLDIAPPPEGYVLLNARAQAHMDLRNQSVRLGIDLHNLTNRRYRDATSLLRYYADQPGFDARVWAAMEF